MRGEPPPPEMASKVCRLAMQIADKLREADDIPHLQEILTVLMSEDAYKTAVDRARALNAVIDSLGETVTHVMRRSFRRFLTIAYTDSWIGRPVIGITRRL
jgi:hypothetical protein